MKKRLLSAALALAMLLTMLPLSAFADDPPVSTDAGGGSSTATTTLDGNGTESVAYQQYKTENYPDAPAWYVTHTTPATADTPAKTEYVKVEDGVIVNSRYYSTANYDSNSYLKDANNNDTSTPAGIYTLSKDSSGNVTKTGLKGNVTVIGSENIEIDAINATSLTLDVYGGEVTIKGAKLTSVTVTNGQYATYGKGTVKLASGVPGQLTSLTLNHVTFGDSSLAMNSKAANKGGATHTLTLNDVTTASTIELDGVGTNDPVTRAAQTVNITNSIVGKITVKGINSTVTLNEIKVASGGSAPEVSIEGTGGNLYVRGGSKLGAVTINGDNTSKTDQTTAPSNITVETGSTVASINATAPTTEKALGRNTVNISGIVTSEVKLKNSAVTVNGGRTGNLTLETGTVTVSGNRASVGDVELAHDATFNLTGSNCTIGELKVATAGGNPATVTFTVPNDPSNTLGGVADTYAKQTISGGTWKKAVASKALSASLIYQLKETVGSNEQYTYYTSNQLGEAVIKQGDASGNTLTKVGVTNATQSVTFMNGKMTWGVLKVVPGTTIPKLPEQMNTVKTPYWSDGAFSNLSGLYNTPTDTTHEKAVTLNAGGGGSVTSDVTKLTDVKVNKTASDIKAALVGNVITLTGAVNPSDTTFTLTLETDAVKDDGAGNEVPVTIELSVSLDASTKTLTFVNPGSMSLGNGVVLENTFKAIRLSSGTQYTLNGQGLVVRSQTIKVKGIDTVGSGAATYPNTTAYGENDIEVIVNAAGYTSNPTLKQQIIDLINGKDAAFEWNTSPAVKQAVNAALATITDASVENYIKAAQSRARNDHRASSTAKTAYDTGAQVWLVPYLEVTVTEYRDSATNASLTANLSIKWRVEVHPADGSTDLKVNKADNVANDAGTYIAKTGTALTIGNDLGEGVSITFKKGVEGATYAHQAVTYDYEIDKDNKFTVTHAVNGNLGQFVFDSAAPMIKLGTKAKDSNTIDDSEEITYFSSLQAAVDAAEEGQLVEINSSYKGSTNINMTGKARTIYIQANGKNVVVANASGGLVEENSAGSFYTIKLNRDNTVTATTATVRVGSAANGTARLSAGSAKPGDSVTLYVTPNTGYQASTPTATANNGAAVIIRASGTNTWTITVPAGATDVIVTPRFVLTTGLPYTDVADTSLWYYQGVKYCYDTQVKGNRLMQGVTATTFSPNTQLTRAQVVQILWNMAGQPVPKTTRYPFTDVIGTGSDWAQTPIIWAAENGYVVGYTDGKFRPDAYVSRQDMILILYRYANKPAIGTTGSLAGYNDGGSVGSWATDAVRWATSMGILSGANSTSLNGWIYPTAKAKRSEVAVTIANFHRMGYVRS